MNLLGMCRHEWEESERFVAPRADRAINVKRVSQEAMERLVFGVTTILYRCKSCHCPKTAEILGSRETT